MISVTEAHQLILDRLFQYDIEPVPIDKAAGRILAEDIFADSDLPPFHRVMMDGIAVRLSDIESGVKTFNIIGIQRAGETQKQLNEKATCLEVMTGAVCPLDADAVIPYEKITISDGVAHVHEQTFKPWMNIHRRGMDKQRGELLVPVHTVLSPAAIGVAASVGKTVILVARLPRVIVFSTGDELVEVSMRPASHQIRRSNVFALHALLLGFGINADTGHLPDEESSIEEAMKNALENWDVILLTGGVSKGKFDLIPDVLSRLQVEMVFHRIAQKPGKPMWFGKKNKVTVFAFPGNPVSTMLCAVRYLLPWLRASFHHPPPTIDCVGIREFFSNQSDLTRFMLVRLTTAEDGRMLADIIENHGSGDFVSMTDADGFIEVPQSEEPYPAGYRFNFFSLRNV